MNYKHIVALSAFLLIAISIKAQDNAGLGTSTPNQHAILDMVSSEKGLLIPRLTTAERNTLTGSLATTEEALMVYDTDLNTFQYWDGTQWVEIGGGADADWTVSGNDMYSNNSGNIGIGTSTPQFKLEVNGLFKSFGTTEISDQRHKEQITTIDDALLKVESLRGVSYQWKQEQIEQHNAPKGAQIGFIAQEVELVLPELVQTTVDGFKSVDYSHLVAVLVEAIKEQQYQIRDLQADRVKVAELSETLESLKAQLGLTVSTK